MMERKGNDFRKKWGKIKDEKLYLLALCNLVNKKLSSGDQNSCRLSFLHT